MGFCFLYSGKTKKREDYLEWPEYFMAVAFLSAQRSKDPSSQVRLFAYVSGLKQILYYEFISKILVYRTEVWFRFRRVCYYEFTVVVVICMSA